jgi:hypothetical protein
LANQKNKDFEITKASRLRYRTRYFIPLAASVYF